MIDCPYNDEEYSEFSASTTTALLKKGIFGINIENVEEHIKDVAPFLVITNEEWQIMKKFVNERGTNWWYCAPPEYVEMECAKLSDLMGGRLSPIHVYCWLTLPTKWNPEWNN